MSNMNLLQSKIVSINSGRGALKTCAPRLVSIPNLTMPHAQVPLNQVPWLTIPTQKNNGEIFVASPTSDSSAIKLEPLSRIEHCLPSTCEHRR
jgi:hypothetical protein